MALSPVSFVVESTNHIYTREALCASSSFVSSPVFSAPDFVQIGLAARHEELRCPLSWWGPRGLTQEGENSLATEVETTLEHGRGIIKGAAPAGIAGEIAPYL